MFCFGECCSLAKQSPHGCGTQKKADARFKQYLDISLGHFRQHHCVFSPAPSVIIIWFTEAGSWLLLCHMRCSKFSLELLTSLACALQREGKDYNESPVFQVKEFEVIMAFKQRRKLACQGGLAHRSVRTLSSMPKCPKQASHQFLFYQVHAPPAVWAGKLLTLSPCSSTPGVPQKAGQTH